MEAARRNNVRVKQNVENLHQVGSRLLLSKTAPKNNAAETKPRAALGEVGSRINQQQLQPKKDGLVKKKVTAFGSTVILPKNNSKSLIPKPATTKNSEPKQVALVKPHSSRVINAAENTLKNQLPALIEELEIKQRDSLTNEKKAILNVDLLDDDIFLVPEYIQDIIRYLRDLESKYPITKGFLQSHASTPTMRTILVDWLAQVCEDINMTPETLHLTVACVDRYLQVNKEIGRQLLQLVGVAALFLASKYEEMYYSDVKDLAELCDGAYTTKEIIAMEQTIFRAMDFSLSRPLSIRFLRRFDKLLKASAAQHCLAKYILELALQEYTLCHLDPSLHAAAASCLAICVQNTNGAITPAKVWTDVIVHHSGYEYKDIRSTVFEFAALLLKAETYKYQAIRIKYSQKSKRKVSVHPNLKDQLVVRLAANAKLVEYKEKS